MMWAMRVVRMVRIMRAWSQLTLLLLYLDVIIALGGRRVYEKERKVV